MKLVMTIRDLRAVLEAARIVGTVLVGAAVAALIITIAEKAIPQAAHDAIHREHKGAWQWRSIRHRRRSRNRRSA